MSLLVARAMEYVQNQIPGAEVSNVGATIFVRNANANDLERIDGANVVGRTLVVDDQNSHTEAAIVKMKMKT